jgi:pyruvate dehydrogenase E1 component alpha subunit/2-oxoisovalerate dehydrogenase E1 component
MSLDPPPSRPEEALELYRRMFLIRTAETRLLELFSRGLVRGTIHTCLGQEACAVGVMEGIRRDRDLVFSHHRAHGHFLAYCDDLRGLLAEILGRAEGVCGGIGGSQHLYKDNFYSNGVQGGMIPVALGAALAEKRKASAAVAVAFLGDGTMGQGIVYECFNLASLWKLPVLFVLEDNQYAQSTPKAAAQAGDLARRAEPFGIPTFRLDGDDPLLIARTVRAAREESARGQGPAYIVLDTYRLGPHSKGDDSRSPEELAAHWARDPLPRFAARLPEEPRRRLEEEVCRRVEETIAWASGLPAAGSPPAPAGG